MSTESWALVSWDSSVHDCSQLNKPTPNGEVIYVILRIALRICTPGKVNFHPYRESDNNFNFILTQLGFILTMLIHTFCIMDNLLLCLFFELSLINSRVYPCNCSANGLYSKEKNLPCR